MCNSNGHIYCVFKNKFSNLSREEPEKHVVVCGRSYCEESGIALDILILQIWEWVHHLGETLGSGNVPTLDVWCQIEGLSHIPTTQGQGL